MAEPVFTISEVAAMVGMSPHTIRSWERRHGVLAPWRTMSRRRRYSADDVELLLQVKRAVAAHGLSVKVAVEVAQGTLAPPVPENARGGEAAPRRRRRRPMLEIDAGEPPWRVIVDLMAYVVVVLDGRGSILEVNAAAARALGVPGERLPGRRLLPFLDRAELPRARVALQAPFRRRMDWQLRLRNVARPLSVDCLPFSYHGQARLAIIGRGRQDPEARAG